MNKATAIKAITGIIKQIGVPTDSNIFQSKFNRNDTSTKYTIASIEKPKLTINAIHFNGAKKRIKYRDWNNPEMKRSTLMSYEKLLPYANETELKLKLYSKQNPEPFTTIAYSLPKYSDVYKNGNRVNLVKYITDNFTTGNVVNAKLVTFSGKLHITWVKKIKDMDI